MNITDDGVETHSDYPHPLDGKILAKDALTWEIWLDAFNRTQHTRLLYNLLESGLRMQARQDARSAFRFFLRLADGHSLVEVHDRPTFREDVSALAFSMLCKHVFALDAKPFDINPGWLPYLEGQTEIDALMWFLTKKYPKHRPTHTTPNLDGLKDHHSKNVRGFIKAFTELHWRIGKGRHAGYDAENIDALITTLEANRGRLVRFLYLSKNLQFLKHDYLDWPHVDIIRRCIIAEGVHLTVRDSYRDENSVEEAFCNSNISRLSDGYLLVRKAEYYLKSIGRSRGATKPFRPIRVVFNPFD